jgi:hypothetical protein
MSLINLSTLVKLDLLDYLAGVQFAIFDFLRRERISREEQQRRHKLDPLQHGQLFEQALGQLEEAKGAGKPSVESHYFDEIARLNEERNRAFWVGRAMGPKESIAA